MADPVDIAQDHMEREAPHILAASKKPAGPVANGRCHFCDEDLADPDARFCDKDCLDGYEREQKAVARNGAPWLRDED